ncbi:MAG: cellulase family glycosylhydrolase [Bacteroidota bacterium]
MCKYLARHVIFFTGIFLAVVATSFGKTIVFFEKDFSPVENGAISRTALERAFASLNPHFVNLADLQKSDALAEGDLLILPYGSAFPADAWETIRNHLNHGNLLVLGGRPFFVPVYRDSTGWRVGQPQNSYARSLGIEHSYAVPQHGPWSLQWDEDAPWFHDLALNPRRVFVNAGYGERYRGLGFLVDADGNRLAAPVVAEDLTGYALPPRRRVYLSFDSEPAFWDSDTGIELLRKAAIYASCGGIRLWLNLQQLTLDSGEHVSGTIDVLRSREPGQLTLELMSGSNVLAARTITCGTLIHEEIGLTQPLNNPGLYKLRATLSIGDTLFERYTSGVCVRDSALLRSGKHLEAGRDYFRLGGKPYLMAGANYFCTDPYTTGFFAIGSLGGNVWVWERDFAEMERQGLTIVRTGIWINRGYTLDVVSGAADERLLRAIEAYLCTAARHNIQVIFTFFAFEPQTEMQQGPGQEGNRLGPGSNPYLDPVSIEVQIAYVRSIAARFRDIPFLSFDLINEPNFSNPKRLWSGNSPNGDPIELAAWQRWLKKRYVTIDRLAQAWRTSPADLGTFDRVPLPAFADMGPARYGNPRIVRAVDYNLFAQDAFRQWADTIIQAIRSTGAQQAITIGQDEGGISDRVLNQFWADSPVSYTVNHSWWRDDALLWSSVAAKTLNKPNIIGETGLQPVWSMDGSWRLDDLQGMPLLERKLALSFANANAGVLHWDWTHSDTYGLMRRDGSQKQWMDVLKGIASFARDAQAYTTEARLPDIALVLPQSLQLSMFGGWGVAAQQNAVRALYHHARATAFVIGEYQLSRMTDAKLIIVPAPWVFHQEAWDLLMSKVKSGATLLISGRIDADEHWFPVPERTREWNTEYTSAALTTREAVVNWPGGTARLSYSGDKTTYIERGVLGSGRTFLDIPHGKGRILYFALPLELADQLNEIGRIYKYAMERAGVSTTYETSCGDPGILICPTQLPEATLYVLTSESTSTTPVEFRDRMSGTHFHVNLAPGRAALMLIGRDGRILASYNAR